MAGITNRGKKRILDIAFRNQNIPTNLYIALFTSGSTPTADTNTFSELIEIASGNGYTSGGYQLSRNTTDFDTINEEDGADRAIIQIKDIVWTATGGSIPSSGVGARYACLTDDNATMGSRDIIAFWDLSVDRYVSSGQQLTLANLEIDATE